jgi:hypothetical protein
MLSTCLRSRRAVLVNIEIMRAFVKRCRILESNKGLAHKLEEMEKTYDAKFRTVFAAIRELMTPPPQLPAPPLSPPRKIGFRPAPIEGSRLTPCPMECHRRVGLDKEWETTVKRIREGHHRNTGAHPPARKKSLAARWTADYNRPTGG